MRRNITSCTILHLYIFFFTIFLFFWLFYTCFYATFIYSIKICRFALSNALKNQDRYLGKGKNQIEIQASFVYLQKYTLRPLLFSCCFLPTDKFGWKYDNKFLNDIWKHAKPSVITLARMNLFCETYVCHVYIDQLRCGMTLIDWIYFKYSNKIQIRFRL